MKKMCLSVTSLFLLLSTLSSSAQSISLTGAPYTQDFNTLANTGTSSVLPSGWLLSETGTGANATYSAGTGSATAGDSYSFGAAASTERAFGGLQSGSVIPTIGASFVNNTGSTVTSLTITYTGEQWRLGATGRVDRMDFQYSLTATSISSGTYIDADALDFTAPVQTGATGALDGNAAANRTNITFTLTGLSIPDGAAFFIRWNDLNASGADDGLAIDDFTISTSGAVTTNVTANAGADMAEPATNGTFTVNLTSAAPAGGVTITYSLSGTALQNTDYTDPQAGAITIPQGATSGTVTLNVTDDATPEPSETIIITLNTASNGYTITGPTAAINVIDNDVAPISLTGAIYTQDFNTLANTGTSTSLPTGWIIAESGTAANTSYTAGTGSSNTGDTYSFGAAASADRTLGGLRTGSLAPSFGGSFINNTGSTITSLRIAYTGKQWRLGGTGRNDRLDFQYSTDATTLTDGTWLDVDQLDFIAPNSTGTVGALDGNAGANSGPVAFTITGLSITNGSTFFIRWNDLDVSGADDGLGIDDLSVETNPADNTPPLLLTLNPANSSTGVASTVSAEITFDENIQKGTGNIVVKKTSDNSIVQTIDVSSTAVAVSGTHAVISLSGLAANTGYYIEIDNGAIKDLANNSFAGIAGSSTWTFTTGTLLFNATFNVCSSVPSEGFTAFSAVGPQVWACTTFGRDANNPPTGSAAYGLQINGFDVTNIPNEDWLISPSFDLTATTFPILSFYSRTRFNGSPLQLKISTDYPGSGDPRNFTWTDINGKFPGQTTDVWTLSDGINLAAFKSANVHIAFVYTSSADDGARWTLDDISLNNSATPPPASLTLSTDDIQFGYVAGGATSTKTFTVTGNDITGPLTITAAGSFLLSTDNTTFTSSVSFTQAEANNIIKTVYVQFAPALNDKNFTGMVTVSTTGVADTLINLKGSSIDPIKTLEVVNWNLEWFGSTTLGPTNDNLQEQNVKTVLQNTGADLYGLVEVVDEARLANIVSQMPGYSYVICNYGSHTNINEAGATPLSEAQKEAFVYKTSMFSNISTTPLLTQGINSSADLTNPAYNYFSSGRFPFMMTADVNLNGDTKTIRFVLLHAKANTSPTATAYDRRKRGSDTLHFTLNNLYPNDNIILLGDFNDDLDQSITDGFTTTSYSAFTTDNTNFFSPTLALSLAGKKSTVSFNDVIDHVMLSNEMKAFYMSASSSILTDVTSVIPSYGTTTSDHYPVFTRYAFDAAVLPVKLVDFNAVKQNRIVAINWTTAEETNTKEFVIERAADGSRFSNIGTVSAKGKASAYTFNDGSPIGGNNYYRLKMVDADNKFAYSKVVKLVFTNQPVVKISPNPASSFVKISMENINERLLVQLIDMNGKIVKQQAMAQGIHNTEISIGGLSKGLYTIKVVGSKEVSTQKLVIQ